MPRDDAEPLARDLDLGQAASLVVGIVIGSGIFVAAHRVAQAVESVTALLLVWVGAGALTLLGALVYAEFGALFPRSGGDYAYARESLGPFWGFFNGWMAFSLNYPASLAALALAWAMQLEQLKPASHSILFAPEVGLKLTALLVLAIFVIVNYFGVRQGGRTQLGVTVAKVALILGLVVFGLAGPKTDYGRLGDVAEPATLGFSLALVAALFAYDGWTGVTRVAGEVKDPQRNVPRALLLGLLGVVGIYVLLTLAYLLVLGLDGMRGEAVASRTAEAVLGQGGETFITILILVSILGPINGLTLAGPRVYYAMARDRLFPALFSRVHPVHRVPHASIVAQSLVSGFLALLFTRDQLFSFVILASWTSYTLTAIGLIRLRRSDPNRARPYRVPLYPWTPLLLIVLSSALIAYLFVDALGSTERVLGLPQDFAYFLGNVLVMLLGIPIYHFFVRRGVGPRAD